MEQPAHLSTVTGRALAVLAAFEGSSGALTASRIAQRAGLPLSTTYRLIHELEAWGGLEKMSGGRYQIGMRIWELGQFAGRRLRERARPYLQDLFDLTHENVQLAVREGTQTLYVDKIYGSHELPRIARIGSRLPLHTTAVGRVLLAAQPTWFIDAYLERELEAPTTQTLTDPSLLRDEIMTVRQQGYSITVEQMRAGKFSLAQPVIVWGETVAAVGMVLDKAKVSEAKRFRPLLAGTVERIEQSLTAILTQ